MHPFSIFASLFRSKKLKLFLILASTLLLVQYILYYATQEDSRDPLIPITIRHISPSPEPDFQISQTYRTSRSRVIKVFVYIHIQKTGGTLVERNLLQSIRDFPNDCLCNRNLVCPCARIVQNDGVIFVSRWITGWLCGVHADLTMFRNCLPTKKLPVLRQGKVVRSLESNAVRRYRYFTVLRSPLHRFISEWRHVNTGHVWPNSPPLCLPADQCEPCSWDVGVDGEVPRSKVLNITLTSFLQCQSNKAIQRQSRMLADRTLLFCQNPFNCPPDLLQIDAKHSILMRVATFGLYEHLILTQYVFSGFGIAFDSLLSTSDSIPRESRLTDLLVSHVNAKPVLCDRILDMNNVDVELYAFARKIFVLRLTWRLIHDSSLESPLRRKLAYFFYGWRKSTNALHRLVQTVLSGSPDSIAGKLVQSVSTLLKRRGSAKGPPIMKLKSIEVLRSQLERLII